jgi:tetratricopeptide (TPR) repeat protein
LLIQESKRQPVLLVFEDLHWIDGETQILLDLLVESLPASHILLIVDYRPEYNHSWGSKTYYRQLRLDTLPQESSDELLGALVGEDTALGSLKKLLIERTGGNPLFLEESVRMLVETKILEGERGNYRLVGEPKAIQVPATVQAILAARIDRLPPEEKRLLQSAAVIGKDVPFTLLNEIAEDHNEELRRMLAHLQTAEFIYETSLFPELEYTFKHALTHEVAYSSLLQDRRIALHGAIVDAMERLYPERMTERVEQVALHAFRGELWNKASLYLQMAGRRAELRSANREATTYFEQALATLKHRPVDQSSIGEAIDLHLKLRGVLFPLAELKRDYSHLQEAETLARSLGDQRRLGRTLMLLGHHFWGVGEIEQAIDACGQAWRIIEPLDDFGLRTWSNFYFSQAYHACGDYQQAIIHGRWNVTALGDKLKRTPANLLRSFLTVLSLQWLDMSLAEIGTFKEGVLQAEEGLRIARAANHIYSLFHANYGMGYILLRKGNIPEAIKFYEEAMVICHKADLAFMQAFAAADLGRSYILVGRTTEGLKLIRETVDKTANWGMTFCHANSLLYLAEAYLPGGQIDEAVDAAERSLELSRKNGMRGVEAWSLYHLGGGVSHSQNLITSKAEDYYQQAIALAKELGMQPLIAHCYLGLGELYALTEDKAKAEGHLIKASDMFREMEMNFWLQKAEAILAEHLR